MQESGKSRALKCTTAKQNIQTQGKKGYLKMDMRSLIAINTVTFGVINSLHSYHSN